MLRMRTRRQKLKKFSKYTRDAPIEDDEIWFQLTLRFYTQTFKYLIS